MNSLMKKHGGDAGVNVSTAYMMCQELMISDLLEYAAHVYGRKEIITRRLEGDTHRYSYKEALQRSKKLANALTNLGVKIGDRVGTMAWNTYRHFECYYGISGMGAICHTINPRLFIEQIDYIIHHAETSILLLDACFVPLIEPIASHLEGIKAYIVLIDEDKMPSTSLPNALCYEALMADSSEEYVWPQLSSDTPASLCYTSGTTGNPKGVLYTHRSTILHAYASRNPDALNVSSDSVVMPVVPMYHVCAWGIPYIAPMAGATLVLPGSGMESAQLYELVTLASVDLMLGVPTIWLRFIDYLRSHNLGVPTVHTIAVGGAAAPKSLVEELDKQYGVYLLPIWGMTETSPLATLGAKTHEVASMSTQARYAVQVSAGKPLFGIEVSILDERKRKLPHDGNSKGFLFVRGPWVLNRYYKLEKADAFFRDDQDRLWFDTGDIAVIDEKGYVSIVDRAKDMIKSGGEWISSIDLENTAVGHPEIKEACVIGARHPKWEERPLLFIVKQPHAAIDKEQVYQYLSDRLVKWWLPDDVIFLTALPHTATGKLQKKVLRDRYENYFTKPVLESEV